MNCNLRVRRVPPLSAHWKGSSRSFAPGNSLGSNPVAKARGRQESTTDPLGERVSYTYDGLNNLLTSTDPLGEITQYGYDPDGNLTSVTDPVHGSTPTQFFYNNFG